MEATGVSPWISETQQIKPPQGGDTNAANNICGERRAPFIGPLAEAWYEGTEADLLRGLFPEKLIPISLNLIDLKMCNNT